jgi:hypothetical protein
VLTWRAAGAPASRRGRSFARCTARWTTDPRQVTRGRRADRASELSKRSRCPRPGCRSGRCRGGVRRATQRRPEIRRQTGA